MTAGCHGIERVREAFACCATAPLQTLKPKWSKSSFCLVVDGMMGWLW